MLAISKQWRKDWREESQKQITGNGSAWTLIHASLLFAKVAGLDGVRIMVLMTVVNHQRRPRDSRITNLMKHTDQRLSINMHRG